MTGKDFYKRLTKAGYDYFAGVPDSTLSPLIFEIDKKHAILHNEGGAIAAACGYYLSTGKTPIVYIQNSGLGNALNPLLSLADLYDIPILLIVGYRGQIDDAPEHITQGLATEGILKAAGIEYCILDDKTDIEYVDKIKCILAPFGFLMGKKRNESGTGLSRKEVIKQLLKTIGKTSKVITTAGYISRDTYQVREDLKQSHDNDFYSIGAMGHAGILGNAIAENTKKKVFVFDGDGSLLMHLGALACIGDKKNTNYIHVVFNNGCYDSVGGMKTIGIRNGFSGVARRLGIQSIQIYDFKSLNTWINEIKNLEGPFFIEIFTKPEEIKSERIPSDNLLNLKSNFMDNIK